MINQFERENTKVKLLVDSDLGTDKPYYPFTFECGNENVAELLTRHLNEELEKYRIFIAKSATDYLEDYQIAYLKKQLKRFNSKTGNWK